MNIKTYEKPRLVALSVAANNMLCASCAIDIYGSNANADYLAAVSDIEKMGFTISFGVEDTCGYNGTEVPVAGYCKFTGSNMVINS